jgi:hypothetical protein
VFFLSAAFSLFGYGYGALFLFLAASFLAFFASAIAFLCALISSALSTLPASLSFYFSASLNSTIFTCALDDAALASSFSC